MPRGCLVACVLVGLLVALAVAAVVETKVRNVRWFDDDLGEDPSPPEERQRQQTEYRRHSFCMERFQNHDGDWPADCERWFGPPPELTPVTPQPAG